MSITGNVSHFFLNTADTSMKAKRTSGKLQGIISVSCNRLFAEKFNHISNLDVTCLNTVVCYVIFQQLPEPFIFVFCCVYCVYVHSLARRKKTWKTATWICCSLMPQMSRVTMLTNRFQESLTDDKDKFCDICFNTDTRTTCVLICTIVQNRNLN